MGDRRFEKAYDEFTKAPDREEAVHRIDYEDLIHALAAASARHDPLVANVLATEALNRYRRRTPIMLAAALGGVLGFAFSIGALALHAVRPDTFPDANVLLSVLLTTAAGLLIALLLHPRIRHAFLARKHA
ncbi:MAG: hypothetical protein WDA16_12275 [Candidatus Thermoplasmatota archaeon]